MELTYYLLLAIALSINSIFASNYFVVKVNGDTVWGDSKIKYGFASSRVYVGNDTISGDSVEYISNFEGIQAKTPRGGFAELQKQGQKIDLFSTWHLGYTGFPVVREYYRINNSKLKSINYDDVKSDFSEFEDSKKMIEEYEFAERWDHWLMIGGIAILASGLAIEPDPDKAGLPVKAIQSTGSISFFLGAGFWMTKGSNINKAVHMYFTKEKK